MHFKMSSAICFNLDQSKILSSGYGLIHSHDTSYQASHHVHVKIKLILYYTMGHEIELSFGLKKEETLTHYQTTNFRLFQTERVFTFLYARQRQDVLWDHPWRAGGVQFFVRSISPKLL